MDADLFASKKKPSSAPAQTKPFGNEGQKKDSTALANSVQPEGAGNSECSCMYYFLNISFTLLVALKFSLIAAIRESCVSPPLHSDEPSIGGKELNSAPSTSKARNYKKFTFSGE